MISVTIHADEGVWGVRIRAYVYEIGSDDRRTLVMEQTTYSTVPPEEMGEDGLYLACVALRQWALRTLRHRTSGQSPDKID